MAITLLIFFCVMDDIILVASRDTLHESIMTQLSFEFAMNDIGPLGYFLDISVPMHFDDLFSQKKNA